MLYIVPTPLGNLEDVTQRSLRVLREVRAVLCEDTRRTRILLSHFGIPTPTVRYNEADATDVERALERLRAGEDLALVSDAGTPVVSDPGLRLVSRARAERLPVTSLPGCCAAAAAVAGSGLPGDSFLFLGFLPRSPGKRRKALAGAAALGRTTVVYESPFRVLDLLRLAGETFGLEARASAARELTKLHEEWITGTVAEVLAVLESRERIQGEFVVTFHPGKSDHGESRLPLSGHAMTAGAEPDAG